MALSLPTASRNAAADAVAALADGGSIEIRSGAKPASANDAATGTLLATIALAANAFAAAGATTAGVADLAGAPRSTTAAADGTAGWFRVLGSTGGTVFDGSVGATGSGADLTLNSVTITTGGTVQITSGSITMPA